LKSILILGATGSIGASACDVVRTHPRDFCVAGIAVRSSRERAEALGREFNAPVFVGEDAALRAVKETEADLVLVSTVGLSGLAPTLAAIEKGENVALATKEVMVAAGELVCKRAEAKGVKILPVDSEHSAIFQCIEGAGATEWRGRRDVAKLVLTASGGPFLDGPDDLSAVTPAQALNHPRWKMGPKVTVDSSTMMNKGFEILEARWLFDIPVDRIDVVVHPESIVHSLVEFVDGATLAQLSPPDMRVPIQYAFSWPQRLPAERRALDLPALASLTFRAPSEERFPCLRLVKEAARAGGTQTAALSAADEIAVERFLSGEILYTDIPRLVSDTMHAAPYLPCDSLENILSADSFARDFASRWSV
jgi:1-deoxy-D-xylulose-5-phosphate reductoisomerase